MQRFINRYQAGKILAEQLKAYAHRNDVLVLGLPRGGVPVAYEVAKALRAPLDIFMVRKLGFPGHEELAMGAIATGGSITFNQGIIDDSKVDKALIDHVIQLEQAELSRRDKIYRGKRPFPDFSNKTIILVDDGIATGATIRVAIKALRQYGPTALIIAVPAAADDTCKQLEPLVEGLVCPVRPLDFYAVGSWYDDFSQTTDEEVISLLEKPGERDMTKNAEDKLIELIREVSEPLHKDVHDPYASLLGKIGDARVVMLGEASHGTHEFYQARIDITKKLITDKGFMGVAIEGDWPDVYHVHRYIQGQGNRGDSIQSLEHFKRFPTWMWRNTTMPPFLTWLREHNDSIKKPSHKLGFYGLDLYNMSASMHAIIDYLRRVDPKEAERAIAYYSCFDHMDVDPQAYGYLAAAGLKQNCINEVVTVLYELQQHAFEYVYKGDDKSLAKDNYFSAIQNARLIKNAENYYRSLFRKDCNSWNIRDMHMAEMVDILLEQLEQQHNKPAKLVIWAHNSHVGDARATEMSDRGEVNLGQLIRGQHNDTYNIGFSTYEGYVTAAYNWDEPAEHKEINPGIPGSYEDLFHRVKHENFILDLMHHEDLAYKLQIPRLQRAIGVIYRPETERMSHYFFTHLTRQFNSMIHFDKTKAVQPLDVNPAWRDIR